MTPQLTNSARLAARPIHDGGTPVAEWARWQRRFPALDIDECLAMVLVAAHPDDETLGLGATAAMLARRGVTVQIVAVTDGEAAYSDDRDGRERLSKVRRDELRAAAERLGLPKPILLRMPDGEVATHERRLTLGLEALMAGFDPGTWCATTWRGDGHPDHEATGRAAAAAAQSAGALLIEYPIWMWHWATPDDPAVPWQRARRIDLAPHDLATKTEAVRCFASQVERGEGPPLLTDDVIERQLAVGEIVFVGRS
jgi:LmbE family N-acetylglucosaminyl deacetylase